MTVLTDLLAQPDQAAILDGEVIPEMVRQGVLTTSWAPGDLARADAYVAAKLRAMSREQLAVLAATRFGDYLWGFLPLPNATPEQQAGLLAWAPIIAKQAYGIDQIVATYTLRTIVLTNSTANVYNKATGRITITFPSGNRYVSYAAYVSAGNDVVPVVFRSEFTIDATHAYSDTAGTSGITFLTADLPGVTATNPAATYTAVAQVGSGLGTIVPSQSPNASYVVRMRIDSTGVIGVGTWSANVDGAGWVSQGAIGTINDLHNFGGASTNIKITPNNNGGGFQSGTYYSFSSPGSDVTQVGRAAETPQELGTRVRAQYPLLAFVRDANGYALPISPVATAYQALVLTAFPEVKTCYQRTSTTINNVVNVYVAGEGALLSGTTISAIQAFLNSLGMIGDRPVVASPSTQAITLAAATVTVKAAQAASAKATAQDRVTTYLRGLDPISPLPYGGLVDRSYLLSLIRSTPGVTHVDDALTINGAATDYQLAAATMATYSGDVSTSLTWATS